MIRICETKKKMYWNNKKFLGVKAEKKLCIKKKKLPFQKNTHPYKTIINWYIDKIIKNIIFLAKESKFTNHRVKIDLNKDWNKFKKSILKNKTKAISERQMDLPWKWYILICFR